MTTVIYARAHSKFIEIKNNLRRKNLYWTNQGNNFLGGSFSNIDSVRTPIQLRREKQFLDLKRLFFFKNRPMLFTSIVTPMELPELLDGANETSWVFPALKSTSHFLPQSTVSHKPYYSSEANPNCCQKSDAWSHWQ